VISLTLNLINRNQDNRSKAECYRYYYCSSQAGEKCTYAGDCNDFPGGYQDCSDRVYQIEGKIKRCYLDENCSGLCSGDTSGDEQIYYCNDPTYGCYKYQTQTLCEVANGVGNCSSDKAVCDAACTDTPSTYDYYYCQDPNNGACTYWGKGTKSNCESETGKTCYTSAQKSTCDAGCKNITYDYYYCQDPNNGACTYWGKGTKSNCESETGKTCYTSAQKSTCDAGCKLMGLYYCGNPAVDPVTNDCDYTESYPDPIVCKEANGVTCYTAAQKDTCKNNCKKITYYNCDNPSSYECNELGYFWNQTDCQQQTNKGCYGSKLTCDSVCKPKTFYYCSSPAYYPEPGNCYDTQSYADLTTCSASVGTTCYSTKSTCDSKCQYQKFYYCDSVGQGECTWNWYLNQADCQAQTGKTCYTEAQKTSCDSVCKPKRFYYCSYPSDDGQPGTCDYTENFSSVAECTSWAQQSYGYSLSCYGETQETTCKSNCKKYPFYSCDNVYDRECGLIGYYWTQADCKAQTGKLCIPEAGKASCDSTCKPTTFWYCSDPGIYPGVGNCSSTDSFSNKTDCQNSVGTTCYDEYQEEVCKQNCAKRTFYYCDSVWNRECSSGQYWSIEECRSQTGKDCYIETQKASCDFMCKPTKFWYCGSPSHAPDAGSCDSTENFSSLTECYNWAKDNTAYGKCFYDGQQASCDSLCQLEEYYYCDTVGQGTCNSNWYFDLADCKAKTGKTCYTKAQQTSCDSVCKPKNCIDYSNKIVESGSYGCKSYTVQAYCDNGSFVSPEKSCISCIDGVCKKPCGGLNQDCCEGDTCLNNNLFCRFGKCVNAFCGNLDQDCCTNSLCNFSFLTCWQGKCIEDKKCLSCTSVKSGYIGPDRSGGDYNCSGDLTTGDYIVWRDEFLKKGTERNADGDCDGKTSLSDYSRWREEYLK